MSTASIFNKLGQSLMPSALAIAFPDTLNVTGETTSAGTGGGRIKSAAANVYTSVPCIYEGVQKFGWKKDQGDQILSTQMYIITIPCATSAGTRINLDPKVHRLVVAARGNEPAKTFRIVSINDRMGVVFEITASKEN